MSRVPGSSGTSPDTAIGGSTAGMHAGTPPEMWKYPTMALPSTFDFSIMNPGWIPPRELCGWGQRGWVCPGCGNTYSPITSLCYQCSNLAKKITTTKDSVPLTDFHPKNTLGGIVTLIPTDNLSTYEEELIKLLKINKDEFRVDGKLITDMVRGAIVIRVKQVIGESDARSK